MRTATAAPDVAPEAAPDATRCTDDVDRDGHFSLACGGDDCDDANPRAYPGQQPRCDRETVDSDCNGVADAMQGVARIGRCAQEAEAFGFPFPAATPLCAIPLGGNGCRACRGTGASERCICWESGSSSYQGCSP